jgi:hypothetical protein
VTASGVTWALRALRRSHRVRFATAVSLIFHLLSTFMLVRLAGRPDASGFAYITGFVPCVILSTVTQGNLLGVDRGSTLTALATPARTKSFFWTRLVVALLWTLTTLLAGWIIGLGAMGARFAPVVLMQMAFAFLLCPAGGILSVLAPSSRAYSRATGQTTSVTVLVPLNVVGILGIGGAIKLLSSAGGVGRQTAVAAACVAATLAAGALAVVAAGNVFESRRDRVLDALRENP